MEGNIGFIGLGAMGYPMAMNVRKKMSPKSTLYINDVYRPALEKFVKEGSSHGPIEIVDSAKEAAESSNTVISIVPAADHVRTVYLDEKTGVIAASKNSERLLVECSTIDSASTIAVGEKLKEAGAGTYVDAPVSGGVPAAEAGTLAFLAGYAKPSESDPLSIHLVDVMSMMGSPQKFFYCGKLGSGLSCKIANNYLSGTILLASAEAMNFGIRSGVDKQVLYDAIHNSTGQSFMFDHVNPVPGVAPNAPSNRDYQGGFKSQMMIKDMTLGVDAAAREGVRSTLGSAALEFYKECAYDPICVDRDVSVVYRYLGGPE